MKNRMKKYMDKITDLKFITPDDSLVSSSTRGQRMRNHGVNIVSKTAQSKVYKSLNIRKGFLADMRN